jgi:hypothetical protein
VSHLLVIVRATLVTAPDFVSIIQNMACHQHASAAGYYTCTYNPVTVLAQFTLPKLF